MDLQQKTLKLRDLEEQALQKDLQTQQQNLEFQKLQEQALQEELAQQAALHSQDLETIKAQQNFWKWLPWLSLMIGGPMALAAGYRAFAPRRRRRKEDE
ncbi:MAG: hypothetical protein ACK4SA_22000 [Caldilinea sp.]